MNIYRKEHPNPQFYRESWQNLNGVWDFEFDFKNSGFKKGYLHKEFNKKINVPFCPESKLSGIEYKNFMKAVWYRRIFNLSSEHLGQRVLLHFGAVDFDTKVWINNQHAGSHSGGYSSFSFDITEYVTSGENSIVVQAQDDCRNPHQPRGKQSEKLHSHACDYTRTTGIWKTIWL